MQPRKLLLPLRFTVFQVTKSGNSSSSLVCAEDRAFPLRPPPNRLGREKNELLLLLLLVAGEELALFRLGVLLVALGIEELEAEADEGAGASSRLIAAGL
jgi:hypothetical protein